MNDNADTRAYYEGTVEPIYLAISGAILHLGMFEGNESRLEATARTKKFLASRVQAANGSTIVDLGSGYGDAMRFLARRFDCQVIGVNLVHSQNVRALAENRQSELLFSPKPKRQIMVLEADFARAPLPAGCAQTVWSQEAFLHAVDRAEVLNECARLLKPGGRLIFTDILQTGPMEAEEARLIFERVKINSLESFDSYSRLIGAAGFQLEELADLSRYVAGSYSDHVDSLQRYRDDGGIAIGEDFLEYTIKAMQRWVRAAEEGKLGWGMFVAQK
jgi:sarcosine/dimethylglycine N-methyltransferase